MPELPDIAAYLSALDPLIVQRRLLRVRLGSPFLLRTAQPPIDVVQGRTVRELRRIGKRVALELAIERRETLLRHLPLARPSNLHGESGPQAFGRELLGGPS